MSGEMGKPCRCWSACSPGKEAVIRFDCRGRGAGVYKNGCLHQGNIRCNLISNILNRVMGLEISRKNNWKLNKVFKCDKALKVYSIVQYASVCAPLAT